MKKLMLSSVVMLSLTSYPVVAAIPREDVEGVLKESNIGTVDEGMIKSLMDRFSKDTRGFKKFKKNTQNVLAGMKNPEDLRAVFNIWTEQKSEEDKDRFLAVAKNLGAHIVELNRRATIEFVRNSFSDLKTSLSFVKKVNKFDNAVQDLSWILVIRALTEVKEKKDQDIFIKDVNRLILHVDMSHKENFKTFIRLLKNKKLNPEELEELLACNESVVEARQLAKAVMETTLVGDDSSLTTKKALSGTKRVRGSDPCAGAGCE